MLHRLLQALLFIISLFIGGILRRHSTTTTTKIEAPITKVSHILGFSLKCLIFNGSIKMCVIYFKTCSWKILIAVMSCLWNASSCIRQILFVNHYCVLLLQDGIQVLHYYIHNFIKRLEIFVWGKFSFSCMAGNTLIFFLWFRQYLAL